MIHLIVCLTLGAVQPAASAGPISVRQQAAPAVKTAPARPGAAAAVPAQQPKPGDAKAEAYYQFMTAHRLISEGDGDGAAKALRRAMELDPASSQIVIELAELSAKQSQMKEAVDLAGAALKLDADNWDAHRLLGLLYADQVERGVTGGVFTGDVSVWQQAVDHLEKALSDTQSDMTVGVRVTLGRMYLIRQQYDKAIAALKQALADSPWMPQAVSLLADTYTAAGRQGEAVALLKDAVAEEPSFYRALAEAYDKQQRFDEAAAAYEKASSQNPGDTDLKIKWAAVLLNRSETASTRRARELLLEVTKTSPNASWPLYLLARAQRSLNDLDGAETTARRILAINPGSTSGAHALAQVFESRRQYTRVVETLEPIVAKPPQKDREADAVLLLTHLGFAYLELGRGQDATGVFDRAMALSPGDAALKIYRAQALVLAGKYELAITLLRDLRAGAPRDVRLARMEADALRGLGKFDEGVAVLRPLADATGDGPAGVQTLAEYYASGHRYAEAAALLKSAVVTFPTDLNVQFQYGAMLDRLKKHADAERVLRQVLAADANHAPALNFLGYTLVEQGQRVPEAIALIKRAVTLDPYNGAYLDSLGWAQFKLNRLDEAEASLRIAAEQLVRDSVVQDHFGDVLAAKGRFGDASTAWRRSLDGDGESIDRAKIERKIRDAQPKIARQ